MRRILIFTPVLVISIVTLVSFGSAPSERGRDPASTTHRTELSEAMQASLPSGLFVENRGQWPGSSGYRLLGTSMAVALERGRIRFRAGPGLEEPSVSLVLEDVEPIGEGSATRVNWLVGSQDVWRRGLEAHRLVRYPDVADGVDMVVRITEDGLRYDLELDAGMDARELAIRVEGVDQLQVAPSGELVMSTPNGEVRHTPPVAWQETEHGIREISCAFRLLDDDSYGFGLQGHDPLLPTTIDPTLAVQYESFFIGDILSIATDPATGDFFVGGVADGPFPFPVPMPAVHSIGNASVGSGNSVGFVARLSPTDSPSVRYLTLIGGSASDWVQAVALDTATGRLLVYGATGSADFPVTTGPAFGAGTFDAFLLALDGAQGDVPVFSTLLGIDFRDWGDLVLDGSRALVSGTLSNPPAGLFQTWGAPGGNDAFVLAVDPLTGARIGGFVVGGPDDQSGPAVGVDPGNAVYLAGLTEDPASFLETPGSFGVPIPPSTKKRGQTVPPPPDAFLVRFTADLSAVEYSTRIGGEGQDLCDDMVVQGSRVVMIGDTLSASLTPAPLRGDGTYGGGRDAFVAALDFGGFVPGSTPGVSLMAYHGGSGLEFGRAVEVDTTGRIHVAGWTEPGSGGGGGRRGGGGGGGGDPFPEIDNGTGLFKIGPQGRDGFYSVFDLSVSGDALVYSTLIGGSGTNEGVGHLALSPDGKAHVVVQLNSTVDLLSTPAAAYPVRLSGLDSWIGVLGPVLQ